MQVIRFAQLEAKAWRNGAGLTREIARLPEAGPLTTDTSRSGDSWAWRVSIADVTSAGDFSLFPEMERVLTVIEGDQIVLKGDDWEKSLEKYQPHRFSGEIAVQGILPKGNIRDLNVITRTGSFKGFTSITELRSEHVYPIFNGQLGILLEGQATVTGHPEKLEELSQYDAVVGSHDATIWVAGHGVLAVVSILAINGS